MGTFKQYINEERINDPWKVIQKDCKPYLNLIKKSKGLLWRGTKHKQLNMEVKIPRIDRKPRFIDDKLHEWINKQLYEKFGWYPRTEGVFMGGYKTAAAFGKPAIVFPIGKFKYITLDSINKVKLYKLYDLFIWSEDPKWMKSRDERLIEIEKLLGKYKDKGLEIFMKANAYECIMKVEKYYLVPESWGKTILEKIG